MTFRVKPVDRSRADRDPNRRTLYMNIGFGLAVFVAILILVVVGVTSWYSSHLAPAATVAGKTITKDQFTERSNVESFRFQQQVSRIQSEVAAGHMTQTQAQAKLTAINSALDPQTFTASILEKLIDGQIQAGLAADAGVTVTDQQIDQRITDEKTSPEQRHAWVIAVEPTVDAGKTDPTDAQKADAKKRADGALAQIKAGTPFEDVAKNVSTDSTKATGGDLGWMDDTAGQDPAWLAAVFKLDANGVTDVIEGADGTFRIGRVTEIAPAQVDAAWDQKLAAAKVNQDAYRAAIRSEATRQALDDKVVADASKSGLQRKVSELYIPETNVTGAKAIKVRHILYSPKGDPQNASSVPATDPSWAQAQAQAQATYDALVKDPSQFDAIARKDSNETSAKGNDGTGGKLPFFDETSEANGLDADFAKAILADGLQPGQILPPFKSAFGWHVVQVMYRLPIADQMAKLRIQATGGTSFSDLVRDNSEGPKSGAGGDIGWVANGQLDSRLTRAIFAAPPLGVSDVVAIPGDGSYLFKVTDERTAVPDADQLATIKTDAFKNWYTEKKDAVTITRDLIPAATSTQ